MSTNLAGASAREIFSTLGITPDPNAPYTNTGGADLGATLTLTTTAAGVVVQEGANAFSGAGEPIALILSGPGEFALNGANGYTGGTTIEGGELAIGASGALGAGAITFAGDDEILLATVSATLSNSITIDANDSAIIEAATGLTLALAPAGGFASLSGDDAMLHFGSAADAGTVALAPTNAISVQGFRAISVDGGVLKLGDSEAATLFDNADSPLNLGLTAANATLDINGLSVTVFNLSGTASGIVSDGGASATFTTYNSVNSTFAGRIADGAGKIALVVDGSGATTLTLTGANTFTGGTTIDAGQTLAIGDGLTTGALVGAVVDNGALAFDRGDNTTFGGVISGAGRLVQNGTAELTLSGDNTFSGGLTIDAGEVAIGGIAAIGSGGLTFADSDTSLIAEASGVFNDALTIAVGVSATLAAAAAATLVVACSNGFTENGGQGTTLQLGTSDDTGVVDLAMAGAVSVQADSGVSVNGGELVVGNAAAVHFLQQLFGLTVGTDGTAARLDMDGMSIRADNLNGTTAGVVTDMGAAATLTLYNNNNSSYSGVIKNGTGVISVVVQAFGDDTLALNGANSYSGGTTIASGTVEIGDSSALGSGELTFAGNGGGLESSVTATVTNNPITIDAGVSATIGATAGHVLTLAPTSFTDSGGNATTLHIGGATETGGVKLAPTTSASASLLDSVSIDGGTLALGDALAATLLNEFRGGVVVGSGATSATLDLGGRSTIVYNLSGDAAGLVTNNGAAASLEVISLNTRIFDGVVSNGSGVLSLQTSGLGTFELLGAGAYSGVTTIEAGRLVLGESDSAGAGAIAFTGQAFGALAIQDGADPSNTIRLPDATDLIDFIGIGFAFGDRMVLRSAGSVNAYALETAGGAVLENLNLAGALDDSMLIVGGDGDGGAEIAVPYTAAQAANSVALAASSSRILVVDTAANLAANASAIASLIAAGRVASIFTSGATLSDGSPNSLTLVGGDNAITFANSSDDVASLYGTAGAFDTVTGTHGVINLSGAQAKVAGGGDLVKFIGGSGNVADLSNTAGDWDYVAGSNGAINLANAEASLLGGGDIINYLGASGDAISLYQTASDWDAVNCANATVYMTSAQASVTGGDDTIDLAKDAGNIVSIYKTDLKWDSVTGSNAKLFLTESQASVFGGGDVINLVGAKDDRVSIFGTEGAWDLIGGANATIYLSEAQASVVGGDDTVKLMGATGDATSLYQTNGEWDVISGDNGEIYFNIAQASVFGGADTIHFLDGAGNAASLYDTDGSADTIIGSRGTVYLTSAQTAVAGGGDTIDLANDAGNDATLSATADVFDKVNGSGGAIALIGAQTDVSGSNDKFTLSDDSTLKLSGSAELIAFSEGIGGEDVIGGFLSSDTIQLSKLDFANFAAVKAHLTQSGANAVITLNPTDAITLTGIEASSLTASEFRFV